jgi:hypothetical protein
MPLKMTGATPIAAQSDKGQVRDRQLLVPENLPVGTWITVRGTAGGQTHEARLRVCAPVQRRSRVVEHFDDTHLFLTPSWNLKGATAASLSVVLTVPQGWDVKTRRFPIQTKNLPAILEVQLFSNAPAGTEGVLTVALEGLAQPFATAFRVRRVEQQPLVADLQDFHFAWGIARRRGLEMPDPGDTRATFYLDNELSVGRVVKRGFFANPPYIGGIGYTWEETEPFDLPTDPCQFRAFVGIKDGGAPSDGVLFRVEVKDARGVVRAIAEQMGYQGGWRPITGDLSLFAGQRVQLRLIADVGPSGNPQGDWGAWGGPLVQLAVRKLLTDVAPVETKKPRN